MLQEICVSVLGRKEEERKKITQTEENSPFPLFCHVTELLVTAQQGVPGNVPTKYGGKTCHC